MEVSSLDVVGLESVTEFNSCCLWSRSCLWCLLSFLRTFPERAHSINPGTERTVRQSLMVAAGSLPLPFELQWLSAFARLGSLTVLPTAWQLWQQPTTALYARGSFQVTNGSISVSTQSDQFLMAARTTFLGAILFTPSSKHRLQTFFTTNCQPRTYDIFFATISLNAGHDTSSLTTKINEY